MSFERNTIFSTTVLRRRAEDEPQVPGQSPVVGHVPRYVVAVVALFFLVFAVYDVHSQLPANILGLPGEHKVSPSLRKVAPQGWAFFTKSPRSGGVVPFSKSESGEWVSTNLGPHSSPHNVFGANRKSRAQGAEVALLLEDVEQKQWHECSGGAEACIDAHETEAPLPVKNVSPEPTVCGQVLLVEQTAIPWSYRDLVPYDARAKNALRMDVSC